MLPRIFEPFVQVDSSLARSRGGLGIGLALVKSLVEMHGGQRSRPTSEGLGQGSEFTVRLPLARGRGRAAAAPAADRSECGPIRSASSWSKTTATPRKACPCS